MESAKGRCGETANDLVAAHRIESIGSIGSIGFIGSNGMIAFLTIPN
ncbi:MAG TPA: hypothetical protein ACFCUC_12035 [Desulfobacterales bacterium]